MEHTYASNQEAVGQIINSERPIFDQLNSLLGMGGLAVTIENAAGEEILAHHQGARESYSIAQMSDGERNAVILAANVLTVDSGIILLIDEPERHLHRSIIEPFLSALFAQRQDCPFVVSTHDTALPIANPESSVLTLRSCQWSGNTASAWDAIFLESDAELPEDLKRAILGSRSRILFVEGEAGSLDVGLYGRLFPDTSVVPVGGCEDVIKAVNGVQITNSVHRVEAFGLIDRDNREDDSVAKLARQNVYALNTCSVESLYYCSDALNSVAHTQAESLGLDANQLISTATGEALSVLGEDAVAKRMAARRSERKVRNQFREQMPSWKSIVENPTHVISLDYRDWYEEELDHYRALIANGDLEGIIARYPVRETDAIDRMVRALRLPRENYRRMLQVSVVSDTELADNLKQRISPLSGAIS